MAKKSLTTTLFRWEAGSPERAFQVRYTPTLELPHGWTDQEPGLTISKIEHTYQVGDPVEVDAYARYRSGIVTALGRTQVEVRFVRNRSGSTSSRKFRAREIRPAGCGETWCRHQTEVTL